jgi:hypothetical protein
MRQAKTNIQKSTRQMIRATTQKERRSIPDGCEKDPKSMKEREEKPPEGCNNDPRPVTLKPGAAQLWLAGLKTTEEAEKNNNKNNN